MLDRAKGTNQGGDELADTPPYRKKRKQILVRARNELEEDGRVDRHVSPNTEPSEGE
jgi:DNA-binding HxlR family transcriptional regulator